MQVLWWVQLYQIATLLERHFLVWVLRSDVPHHLDKLQVKSTKMYLFKYQNLFVQIAKCICLNRRWVLRSDAPIIWTNCRWNQANPLNLSNPLRPPPSSSFWHLSSFCRVIGYPHITSSSWWSLIILLSMHLISLSSYFSSQMSCPELL